MDNDIVLDWKLLANNIYRNISSNLMRCLYKGKVTQKKKVARRGQTGRRELRRDEEENMRINKRK